MTPSSSQRLAVVCLLAVVVGPMAIIDGRPLLAVLAGIGVLLVVADVLGDYWSGRPR
jgi:hypothetical protein